MTGADQDLASTEVLGPEFQLAIEEAMLHTAGAGVRIRTWQFAEPVVVLGRSSQVTRETHREYCDANEIEIYRRCSGGATVVGGPGCLMYTVVLSKAEAPHLGMIDAAHDFVISRVLRATQTQVPDAERQGICDLTWNDRKF